MSRISRLVVLVASVAAVVSAMAGTAGAVTWHNTGNTAFTATGGAGTLSATGTSLACSSSDATGTAPASTVGATYLVSGTVTFTGCFLVGQAVGVGCTYTLTASTQPVTRVTTTGNADVTCNLTLGGTKLCHISGAPHAIYTNPVSPGKGTLTITHSTLNISGPSCPAGPNDAATLTHQTFTVTTGTGGTGTGGPILHRTA